MRSLRPVAIITVKLAGMSVRLPHVAAKLGADFLDLSAEHLYRACAEGVVEDVHLDFKAEDSYTSSPEGLDELAKDVTGMANAQGGLLVIGIAEDGNGSADHPKQANLGISDKKINQMTNALRSRVVPLYPDIEIRALEDPATPGRGFYLVGIPRSPLAPHAVRRSMRPEYSYALRVGRTTAWLEETEIAARYRDRFRLAEDHVVQVRRVFEQGRGWQPHNQDVSSWVWLDVAVVPAVPAQRRINMDFITQLAGFYGTLAQSTPLPNLVQGFLGRQPLVLRGRLRITGDVTCAEWYADGSAFIRTLSCASGPNGAPPQLNYTRLELQILALLQIAASYADWAGAYGDIDVLASTDGARQVHPDTHPPAAQMQVLIGPRGPAERSSDEPTHLTVPLHSVLDEPTQLLASAYSIAADLLADYGQPETTFIQPDGALRWLRLDPNDQHHLRAWMTTVGLPDQ